MIGIGWATLYACIIESYESYEKKSNFKTQPQTHGTVNK